jgi:hypothetical protein
MWPAVVVIVFFAAITIGGLVANGLGRLPDAVQLEAEDRAHWARLRRESEPRRS